MYYSTTTTTRSILFRHGSPHNETIDVKRTFIHPYYIYPQGYYDVALSELGRRVMFDFEKYGDSPMCLGRQNVSELIGKTAQVQGFGITEEGDQSGVLLQANAKLISNENCAKYINHNISDDLIGKKKIKNALPFGIVDQVLCSMGELNEETERYSVS